MENQGERDALSQTIAAVATPHGPGAVGIVRMSGPQAIQVARRCFTSTGGRPMESYPPHTMIYGDLRDGQGERLDRVLSTYSLAPASYTGEDTVEFHCHGSPMVLSLTLDMLFAQGVRQARPGEFTQRAFLNGKLDLAQAEAVADLLDAQSREGVRHAAGQLTGALSRRIAAIYDGLVDMMAHFHAVLDYPEEDIAPLTEEELSQGLEEQRRAVEALLATYQRGKQLNRGVRCVLVGAPNGGKSSLLNCILGYERAIVTAIPGTTRDTVEESVELGGVPLRLIDTAGVRESLDPVEQLGVERSRAAMESAQLLWMVRDSTLEWRAEDTALLQEAMELGPTILVQNKMDLLEAVPSVPDALSPAAVVAVSAKTGEGLERLEGAVAQLFPRETGECYGVLLTNARQAQAATQARDSLMRAEEGLRCGVTPDAMLTDVEEALVALGQLTGQSVQEDVTARIFQRFCVGK